MTEISIFSIAGIRLLLDSPFVPSSFKAFEVTEEGSGHPREADNGRPACFKVKARPRKHCPETPAGQVLDSFVNDAGHVTLWREEEGYFFEHYYFESQHRHIMRSSLDFSVNELWLDMADPYLESSLSSLVRIAFAQRIIHFNGVTVHASCVVKDGQARLFLGSSGAGKSTHSKLWRRAFQSAWLLNDDCPAVRVLPEGVRVYGTPWSGKTVCYLQADAPLCAVVRLHQAPANEFKKLCGVQAWTAIFPSCSLIIQDESLYLQVVSIVNVLVNNSLVGELWCLPDIQAALLCEKETKII